jgi:hypothetical protein
MASIYQKNLHSTNPNLSDKARNKWWVAIISNVGICKRVLVANKEEAEIYLKYFDEGTMYGTSISTR